MSEYTQEHLDAVKNDRTPLVDRLRGNYGGRTFDYVPAIQIVAADALTAKDRQIAELTRRVEEKRDLIDAIREMVSKATGEVDVVHGLVKLAAATARAERAEGLLRRVEWSYIVAGYDDCCPVCDKGKHEGHDADCPLAAALAAAGTRGGRRERCPRVITT